MFFHQIVSNLKHISLTVLLSMTEDETFFRMLDEGREKMD